MKAKKTKGMAKKTKGKGSRKGIGGRKFTGNDKFCISIHPSIVKAYTDAFDCGLSPAITRGAKYLPVSSGAALSKRSARLNKALATSTNKDDKINDTSNEADANDT